MRKRFLRQMIGDPFGRRFVGTDAVDDNRPLQQLGMQRRGRIEIQFSDEDVWDIAAITAFFGLSNRMANVVSMRPNDEFYLMGRVPKAAPDAPRQ